MTSRLHPKEDAVRHLREQGRAQYAINQALRNGVLIRPDTCELCGATPQIIMVWNCGDHYPRSAIVAHHWRGYEKDALLDIWWCCGSCNLVLSGPHYHSGKVSKDEARAIILARNIRKGLLKTQP